MRLDPIHDALLVIDLQPDFMPGGALAVAGGDELVHPIGALTRRFATVVATQDFHPPGHVSFASSHPGRRPLDRLAVYGQEQVLWPDHCVKGSEGARLHHALPEEELTLILRKGTRRDLDSYSAFRENPGPDGERPSTGLAAWLKARGIRRVFLVGLARDYCVGASALDAAEEGLLTYVVEDLTRAVDPARRSVLERASAAAGVRSIASAELRRVSGSRPGQGDGAP